MAGSPRKVPADLLAEFEAWGRVSDRALTLAEGTAEGEADAARCGAFAGAPVVLVPSDPSRYPGNRMKAKEKK